MISTIVATASMMVATSTVAVLPKPELGFRVGGGPWERFCVGAGVDVTMPVPFLPVGSLRADLESWTQFSPFAQDRSGKALSFMLNQQYALAYVAYGPSFYWTSKDGDSRNGIGFKALVGTKIPGGLVLEGSAILGPAPIPLMISVGKRF